ncbi:MAG: hypothetical protein K6E86_07565 [Bacteroidales bacterium]|nr:hypothetical protein [Bacteroidales bacterium]
MKFNKSICAVLALMTASTIARADVDAADYFDGNCWGWATCADATGTAYTINGGMSAEQPRTVILTTNGGDNASAIQTAISQYDIIVLDGSAGEFTISAQMVISNVSGKTIVGRNGAVLATEFYLTADDIAYLKQQGLESLSSTDQYTGTLPDGTTVTCDKRAFFTKKAMMELQYQKTGVYSLPNKAGIFQFNESCENIIVRNLTLQGPGAVDIDGVDLIYDAYANHLWVDHCTFIDSQDGALDTRGSFNTYTWNHFYYTDRTYSHAYTCGMGWVSNHSTTLYATWGYNIWGAGCNRRLPQADDCYLHLINNYHNCPGNSVGMTLNSYATALVEGNYAASGVNSPLTGSGEYRYIYARNNSFSYTSTSTSVTMPYEYATPISYVLVPQVLTAAHGAGATLDDCFMPLGYNKLSDETFGFDETECSALVGSVVQLPMRNLVGATYTLSTTDAKVVALTSSGTAVAVGEGTAQVIATVNDALYGEYTATVTVNVKKAGAYVSYKKWNFTSFSSATLSNLAADASWTADGSNYTYGSTLSTATLTANGTAIAEADGLLFSSPSGKFVIYGSGRIRMNKAGSAIVIPSLLKDDKVYVTWKSANSSDQRGFTTQNLSNASMLTGGDVTTASGLVLADGDVTLTVTNGIYVSSIEVQRQESTGIDQLHSAAGSAEGVCDLLGRRVVSDNIGLLVQGYRVVLVR